MGHMDWMLFVISALPPFAVPISDVPSQQGCIDSLRTAHVEMVTFTVQPRIARALPSTFHRPSSCPSTQMRSWFFILEERDHGKDLFLSTEHPVYTHGFSPTEKPRRSSQARSSCWSPLHSLSSTFDTSTNLFFYPSTARPLCGLKPNHYAHGHHRPSRPFLSIRHVFRC